MFLVMTNRFLRREGNVPCDEGVVSSPQGQK